MPIEIPARKAAINAKTSFSVALTTFLSSPGVGGAVFCFLGLPSASETIISQYLRIVKYFF